MNGRSNSSGEIDGQQLRRAAMYVRMSTDHQKYSTENQADAIRDYAVHRHIDIVKTYTDSGKSGLSLDGRDALQNLIADPYLFFTCYRPDIHLLWACYFFRKISENVRFPVGSGYYLHLGKKLACFIRSKFGMTMTSRTRKMRSEKIGIMRTDFRILSCAVCNIHCAYPANCGTERGNFSNAGETED